MTISPVTSPPDIEAHLTAALAGITACRVWTVDVQAAYPWHLTRHLVQVDVSGGSKKRAFDKAWQAAQICRQLSGAAWSTGVVSGVTMVSGPAWLPDDAGAPRYVARYLFSVHPIQPTETES